MEREMYWVSRQGDVGRYYIDPIGKWIHWDSDVALRGSTVTGFEDETSAVIEAKKIREIKGYYEQTYQRGT